MDVRRGGYLMEELAGMINEKIKENPTNNYIKMQKNGKRNLPLWKKNWRLSLRFTIS